MERLKVPSLVGRRVLFKLKGQRAIERDLLATDNDGYWVQDDIQPYLLRADIEWVIVASSPYITKAMREQI